MAVVPRKRARGVIVYCVATSWSGGQHWETIGRNKREAEQVDRERRKQVKEGTFKPGRLTDAASVESYAKAWLKTRTNRAAENDAQLLTDHVLSVRSFAELRMGEVRPRHVLQLITDIRAAGKLAEKTIALALGLVRVMFRDAVIDETIMSTPYVVPRGKLTRAGKTRTPYTPVEVAALTSDAVAERDRMWALIAFYTGCRCGEVCGLRWEDLSWGPSPLASLGVERQYDGAQTKTGRRRVVPVHPTLAAALLDWRERWSLHFLRRPGLSDPIVPALDGTPMTKSSAYKGWRRACRAAGVTNRTVHSSRHTFITLTRRGGADIGIVELITHNPAGKIIDVYNHRDWADFCAAVLCLKIEREPSNDPGSSNRGELQRGTAGAQGGEETSALGLERKGHVYRAPEGLPGRNSDQPQHVGSDRDARGHGLQVPAVPHDEDGGRRVRAVAGEPDGHIGGGLGTGLISQSLAPCSPRPEIGSSSSRTRTVATDGSPEASRGAAAERERLTRLRAAGFLGARAPLGAGQPPGRRAGMSYSAAAWALAFAADRMGGLS